MNIMQCQWYSSKRGAATNTTEPVFAGTEPDLSCLEKVPGNHRSTPKKMLAAYRGPYIKKSHPKKKKKTVFEIIAHLLGGVPSGSFWSVPVIRIVMPLKDTGGPWGCIKIALKHGIC